ncbi:hypothetical protein PR048_003335 [Dryococelus australis]|uniref:DUF4817 domain-containing protein n=1 Tax=Dryococelus australis TaxID=614101 RepID=A0ABQ9IMQ4_9NEOP|nr:hypothetical protein PR048_003335 [Dryococelus australis]
MPYTGFEPRAFRTPDRWRANLLRHLVLVSCLAHISSTVSIPATGSHAHIIHRPVSHHALLPLRLDGVRFDGMTSWCRTALLPSKRIAGQELARLLVSSARGEREPIIVHISRNLDPRFFSELSVYAHLPHNLAFHVSAARAGHSLSSSVADGGTSRLCTITAFLALHHLTASLEAEFFPFIGRSASGGSVTATDTAQAHETAAQKSQRCERVCGEACLGVTELVSIDVGSTVANSDASLVRLVSVPRPLPSLPGGMRRDTLAHYTVTCVTYWANRARFSEAPLSVFRMLESCRTMPLVGGAFSGISRFPLPFIATPPHTHLTSPSSALKIKTSMFRAVKISPLLSTNLKSSDIGPLIFSLCNTLTDCLFLTDLQVHFSNSNASLWWWFPQLLPSVPPFHYCSPPLASPTFQVNSRQPYLYVLVDDWVISELIAVLNVIVEVSNRRPVSSSPGPLSALKCLPEGGVCQRSRPGMHLHSVQSMMDPHVQGEGAIRATLTRTPLRPIAPTRKACGVVSVVTLYCTRWHMIRCLFSQAGVTILRRLRHDNPDTTKSENIPRKRKQKGLRPQEERVILRRIKSSRPPSAPNYAPNWKLLPVANVFWGSTPAFRKWESCRTMPFVGGFSRGSPVYPALYSLQSPSSALKTSLLRAAQISSLTHLWFGGVRSRKGLGIIKSMDSSIEKFVFNDVLKENVHQSVKKLGMLPSHIFQHDNDPKLTEELKRIVTEEWNSINSGRCSSLANLRSADAKQLSKPNAASKDRSLVIGHVPLFVARSIPGFAPGQSLRSFKAQGSPRGYYLKRVDEVTEKDASILIIQHVPAFTYQLDSSSTRVSLGKHGGGGSPTHRAFAVEAYVKHKDSIVITQRLLRQHFNLGRHRRVPERHTVTNWAQENIDRVRGAVLAQMADMYLSVFCNVDIYSLYLDTLDVLRNVSLDRRMNIVTMLILRTVYEFTACPQVDLKQGFQKCSVYREQPIHELLSCNNNLPRLLICGCGIPARAPGLVQACSPRPSTAAVLEASHTRVHASKAARVALECAINSQGSRTRVRSQPHRADVFPITLLQTVQPEHHIISCPSLSLLYHCFHNYASKDPGTPSLSSTQACAYPREDHFQRQKHS